MATDYRDAEHRIVGTSALSAMESLNRNRARLDHTTALKNDRPRCVRRLIHLPMINLKNEKCQFCGRSSEEKSETRGTSQGKNEYANGWPNVPSNRYRDTSWFFHNRDLTLFSHDRVVQVMQTKDFTKWNYEALQDVVDGLMYNQKRLEEVIKARFIRRLMAFFSPFSHRFSDIRKNRVSFTLVMISILMLVWRVGFSKMGEIRLLVVNDVDIGWWWGTILGSRRSTFESNCARVRTIGSCTFCPISFNFSWSIFSTSLMDYRIRIQYFQKSASQRHWRTGILNS